MALLASGSEQHSSVAGPWYLLVPWLPPFHLCPLLFWVCPFFQIGTHSLSTCLGIQWSCTKSCRDLHLEMKPHLQGHQGSCMCPFPTSSTMKAPPPPSWTSQSLSLTYKSLCLCYSSWHFCCCCCRIYVIISGKKMLAIEGFSFLFSSSTRPPIHLSSSLGAHLISSCLQESRELMILSH